MSALLTTLRLVVARSLASPSLALFRLLGTLVAVTLICGVSIYVKTMGDTMLQANLNTGDNLINVTNAPPKGQPITPSGYASLDAYLRDRAARDLGLPLVGVQTHHHSVNMPLFRWNQKVASSTPSLGAVDYEYYDGFAGQVRMVAGSYPASAPPSSEVRVIVSQSSAQRLNLRVGDAVKLVPETETVLPVRLVVAGIYTAINLKDSFWQVSPALFDTDTLIVPDLQAYIRLASAYGVINTEYNWLLHLDTTRIGLQDTDHQLAAIRRFQGNVVSFLPGTRLLMSLDTSLSVFRDGFLLLGAVLYALALPVVAIVLYYIVVATELVMEQQAQETVLMRSRGATAPQLLRIYVVESLVFAAVAVALGPFLALPVARAIGATSGFLLFGAGGPFPVEIQGQTFLVGAAAALLALLAGLFAALRAVRRTMASLKREQARARRTPLWQRLYLDVVLLASAVYGYWVVSRQGPTITGDQQAAITQDPLIVLAPTAFVIAGTLLAARLLPPLTRLLALLASRSSPPLLLALRGISRVPQQYVRLMTLLSLTLAVSVFVAAIAGTIGRNTADGVAFRAGAALRLIEYDATTHDFKTLPPAWHEHRPGVLAASPALRLEPYQASLAAPPASDQSAAPGLVLGVDPATLEQASWFRADFATRSLHDLMAALAATPDGIIVSDAYLKASGLRLGDSVGVSVLDGGYQATVVGTVHYFPTMNPPSGLFGLVNLATLLQQAGQGVSGPSEMWLRTNGNPQQAAALVTAVRGTGREVISYQATSSRALTLLDNPLQVGLYGVISVGFLIAAGLSMLSFFVYAYLSVLRRTGEFAVLRALGITTRQTGSILIAEQVLMMALGAAGALLTGLLASRMFVPYLPLSDSPIPPLLLDIPWSAVLKLLGVVALALIPTLLALTWLMGHLQVSRVLRLGDA